MDKKRLYFLDNLKILLCILVIFLHSAQPFGPGGDWPVDKISDIPFINMIVIGMFLGIAASFVMGLFFFISAYFLPNSVERKGIERFLKDRLIHLGIPLLIMSVTILPLIEIFQSKEPFFNSYLHFFTLQEFEFGYLWFISLLLIFAMGYICLRKMNYSIPSIPVPSNIAICISIVMLGIVTSIVRIWFPFDYWFYFHFFEMAHLPQYLFLFIAGILAFRNNWLEVLPSSLLRFWGVIVTAMILILPGIFMVFGYGITRGGITLASVIYSFWESITGIGICICLLIYSHNFWNTTSIIKSVMAQNVYSVYLIHLPIVLVLQWAIIPIPVSSLLQFIIVGITAVIISFIISNFVIRKIPGIKTVFF